MSEATKAAIRAAVDSFPPMSQAATKLITLLRDENADASDLEEALRHDPGLTANILKIANSAYFGGGGKIGSVRQAIVRLGWKKMRELVVASSVNATLDQPVAGYDLPPGELWRHAVAVSVAAELMVKLYKLPAAEEAFTAALLHDLGKTVLGSFVDGDIEEVQAAASDGSSFEEAEREVFGMNHAEVGADLLAAWSLPPTIVDAVRWHHDPDAAEPASTLVDVVHLADALCLILGIGVGREGLQYHPSSAAADRLGFGCEHLEAVASQTLQAVEELGEALHQTA